MNSSQEVFPLKKKVGAIEWKLLVFLVLVMDVKLAVKLFAIVFIYILQPNFRFGFSIKHPRLPLFYLSVILIAVFNFFIYQNFSANYAMLMLSGLLIWTACILVIHQLNLFVERTDTAVLHNTLLAFFVLNIVFSLFNLSAILLDIGFRNPFEYQGQYQKYFINTGDYIKGLTADTSTTNALINCFGIVYFLYRKKYLLVLACMATLLMTASNFSNIILLLVLAGIFLFKSTKEQKSIIVVCITLLVIFFSKISPQNDTYVTETINKYIPLKRANRIVPQEIIPIRDRPDSLLTPDSRKEKIAVLFLDSLAWERIKRNSIPGKKVNGSVKRPEIPKDNIHTALFQWKRDTTLFQRQMLSYIYNQPGTALIKYDEALPGKIIAFRQSCNFLRDHPKKIIFGDGMGNFSSKLAFRATGLKIAGGFPSKFIYCNPDFLSNHLSLYAYFFSKPAELHSIIHNPASVYDQLLTEYGLVGIAALPICYIGFFFRYLKKLSYGLPVLIMLLAFFLVDYWFEQVSIVVLFELMMFINIKEYTKLIMKDE
jgi:hypothetical protein